MKILFPVVKKTFFSKLLTLLSWIGFIPTTKFRLWIFGAFQGFQFLLGLSCLIYPMIPTTSNESISRTDLMYLAVDGTFLLNGLICFFVNYQLTQRFPDVITGNLRSQTTTPRRKYLLLLVSTVAFIIVIFFIIINIKSYFTSTDKNEELNHAIQILYTLILGIALCNVCCHLFLLGCVVSDYKAKSEYVRINSYNKNNIETNFESVLNSYKSFQESVSLGLFMIFTLQTIAAILITYVSIRAFMEFQNIEYTWGNTLWTGFVFGVIAYLAIIADDIDQLRLEVIDNLW